MRSNVHSKWIFFNNNLVFQILRSLVQSDEVWGTCLILFPVYMAYSKSSQLILILIEDI